MPWNQVLEPGWIFNVPIAEGRSLQGAVSARHVASRSRRQCPWQCRLNRLGNNRRRHPNNPNLAQFLHHVQWHGLLRGNRCGPGW
jgi:hypothetical protein